SIAAHATGPIVGDVSNANGWWVKIPCQGFNLLIQGGIVFDVKNEYTHRLPVSFTSKALIVVPIDTNV
ncbi:hypothetical protein, partial [Veillonella magna]|uniref:hypothetical protein n=1 Tax=Veillonella magna TaxID=464322 RepID=UPI001961A1BC